jgi:hypothetical protein
MTGQCGFNLVVKFISKEVKFLNRSEPIITLKRIHRLDLEINFEFPTKIQMLIPLYKMIVCKTG